MPYLVSVLDVFEVVIQKSPNYSGSTISKVKQEVLHSLGLLENCMCKHKGCLMIRCTHGCLQSLAWQSSRLWQLVITVKLSLDMFCTCCVLCWKSCQCYVQLSTFLQCGSFFCENPYNIFQAQILLHRVRKRRQEKPALVTVFQMFM